MLILSVFDVVGYALLGYLSIYIIRKLFYGVVGIIVAGVLIMPVLLGSVFVGLALVPGLIETTVARPDIERSILNAARHSLLTIGFGTIAYMFFEALRREFAGAYTANRLMIIISLITFIGGCFVFAVTNFFGHGPAYHIFQWFAAM